ncbi:MAG TPA: ATP-binding protein [Caldilineaceae bacterium]|nr:ATP-binding protein [Caldilineaceae bacterium]
MLTDQKRVKRSCDVDRRRIKQLEEQVAFFQSVINALPDPLFVKDEEHRVILVNDAHCKLVGMGADEILATHCVDPTPAEELSIFREQDKHALAADNPIENEGYLTDRQGHRHLLTTRKVRHHLPNGKKVIIGTTRDMTERKATEDALRSAKEAAESANHTKSVFLSTITHELRTPMNGVLGLSNLLMETNLSAEQLDLVNAIHTSGNTLLTLINDILDFSKIEANKVELEIQSFDLRLCIERVLDLVAAQATAKGLTLAYLVDEMVPTCIDQDETRLCQILTNLLSNAVKFSDSGEIVVHVQGENLGNNARTPTGESTQPTNNWQLHFRVRDSGIGIPPERMDKLFQPFSQTDSAISRQFGGTGLGLAISKGLVEYMGGTMWAESQRGQGSCFHFTLCAKSSRAQHAPWIESTPMLRGRRILVVEQSTAVQHLLEQQLTTWGMRVTSRNALDWKKLASLPFTYDALIMEVAGAEDAIDPPATNSAHRLLTTLQQIVPNFPVVLLVPLGERPAHNRWQRVATVAKPIHASQLHDALVTVLSNQPAPPRRIHKAYLVDKEMAKRKPLRILVAEDNVVNQKVVAGICANHGYRCDIAADGLEVLDALHRQAYDLILMDLNMPEMDGITTTEIIRNSWPATRQPYIIALTANALSDDINRCLDAGMDDYVSKPIQIAKFARAIEQVPSRFARQDDAYRKEKSPVATIVGQTTDPPSLAPAVDLTTLNEIADTAGNNRKIFFQELITLFLESTPLLLTQLHQANANNDIVRLGQIAHSLRSPAGQLGAHYLGDLCAELEQTTADGDSVQSKLVVQKIVNEYARVEEALQHTLHAEQNAPHEAIPT